MTVFTVFVVHAGVSRSRASGNPRISILILRETILYQCPYKVFELSLYIRGVIGIFSARFWKSRIRVSGCWALVSDFDYAHVHMTFTQASVSFLRTLRKTVLLITLGVEAIKAGSNFGNYCC